VHKWSPDELMMSESTPQDVWDLLEDPNSCTPDFVEDSPRGGAISHMNRLNQAERDDVYALVDSRIREEINKELQAANKVAETMRQQLLADLMVTLERRVEEELHKVSKGAVELAIAMSEQILKNTISIDREAMVKRIASIIGRADLGAELTVIAHPEDLDTLQGFEVELKRMNVVAMIPDKGLEQGSCLVMSEGREWDLTAKGQIESLSEMVRESLLYENAENQEPQIANIQEEYDEPALV
jgi:flagellar biosynthesis/type III secretory pathway protein FliH